MKHHYLLTFLTAAVLAPAAGAAEQILVDWDHSWKYFHTMSDDPSLNDAAIDDTGVGISPNNGPDLIYANFNGTVNPAGAWFAKESDFTSPNGYATLFGKGFGIDGPMTGDAAGNYSSYDGGEGPGPLGYDVMAYFPGAEPGMTGFGTTLTQTPANLRFAAYFRTTFTATQELSKPRIRMLLDDNAVIYYDGVAVARVNRDNSNIAYNDAGATDTTATNNETLVSAGNENVIQSFRLDQPGGPGRATATAGATADSFVTVAIPLITPGEHTIAIIARNSGNNSSDMGMAFQLLADDAAISALVNSSTRNENGTPDDPNDDTFTSSVTVTKLGTASTTWTSDLPPVEAAPYNYGTAYTFGPYPAATPQVINFTADGDPGLTASVTLTAPPFPTILGMNSLPGGSVIKASTVATWTQMPGLPTDRRIQLNNGSAVVNTDPVALTPGTPKGISVSLEYNDNSTGSNAETGDSVKIEVVTDAGTINLTSTYDADGTSPANGSAMNGDDNLLESDELNPDSFPENYTFTGRWILAGIIPASATTMQVRITANNDSASETFRVGNIELKGGGDTDGDGVPDIIEEAEGTNPADKASNFREVGHAITATDAAVTVTSSSSRTYALESSSDLLIWDRVVLPGAPPATYEQNSPGTDGDLTITRPHANPARLFWHVKVHLPSTDVASP